jgi:hypothetical protein
MARAQRSANVPDRGWTFAGDGRRLPVENVGDRLVCLFVEPFGEDFWMQPRPLW